MAKVASIDVLDAGLDVIAEATQLIVCAGEPDSRADALTRALAESETLTGGSFSKAAGAVSGRRTTVAAQNDLTIDDSGTADHVALIDSTRLIYVTTAPSQVLTEGGSVSVAAWDVEIRDPV